MHIWLISAFDPTPLHRVRPMRFMGIALAAISRGHRITFFSSTFQHATKSYLYHEPIHETIESGKYDVVLVHSKPYRKNVSLRRLLAHHDLAKKLKTEVEKQEHKPDLIFISLPPLSAAAKIVAWGKKNNIPVIVDIIDPWPEVFLKKVHCVMKGSAKLLLYPLFTKLRHILEGASGLTAISREYLEWALTYVKKDKPAAYFYPAIQFEGLKEKFSALRPQTKKNSRMLRLIYAGSWASSYDIPAILRAAEIMESKYPGRTEFVIAGAGEQEKTIIKKGLKNVLIRGWLSEEELYNELFLADVALMQHVKGATQSVTYKLFEYLGAGLPVLNSLQGETAEIIAENNVGFTNPPGDGDALARHIEKFLENSDLLRKYKQKALQCTSEIGDAGQVYTDLIKFMENVKEQTLPAVPIWAAPSLKKR